MNKLVPGHTAKLKNRQKISLKWHSVTSAMKAVKGAWQRPRGLTSARSHSSAQVQMQNLVVVVAGIQWTTGQVQWVEWSKDITFKLPAGTVPKPGTSGPVCSNQRQHSTGMETLRPPPAVKHSWWRSETKVHGRGKAFNSPLYSQCLQQG